jgi:diketogulonate reductase-like aldo/keto reductase
LSQVALRFIADRGGAIVAKASNSAWQRENMNIWRPGFDLNAGETAAMGTLANPSPA